MVAEVKKGWKRAAEIFVFLLIIAFSVTIFLFRRDIESVSELSYLGLFVLCFLANATVFLPSPSLMIAASCALILNPWLVALSAALGSALGEFVGFALGAVSKELSPRFQKLLARLQEKIRSPSVLVFLLALLPLPFFDVAGVYSGGTKMQLLRFFALCFAGKLIKMLIYTRLYDLLAWVAPYLPDWAAPLAEALSE